MLSPDDTPRILILGAGAIGGFYGHILSKQGAHVTLVCRSDYEVVKKKGFHILSKTFGDSLFVPHETMPSCHSYQGKYPDFLIVSLKVIPEVDRVELMRPAVGPNTVIVLMENGVEIETEIHEAYPDNQLISCLAFIQVSRISLGMIEHYAYSDLTMGNFPRDVSNECRELARLFEEGGVPVVLHEKITEGRWQKVLWNAPFNPISVLGGVIPTLGLLSAPGGEALVRELMEEIIQIAAATGNVIPPEMPDEMIRRTYDAPAYKTSMALDWERGQDLEVEVIIDNTLKAAQREGVHAPRLQQVQSLIKMMQAQRQKLRI
jgi:2-dehydropantoate 2-reductase